MTLPPSKTSLADTGGRSLDRGEREATAAHGDTDARRVVGGEVRGEGGHAGGGLGLAVHHEQVEPALLTERDPAPDRRRVHPAPGLGEQAQPGQVPRGEARCVEQVERVGHPGERRPPGLTERLPEAGVHDRQVGEQHSGADRQVAEEDREAVAVLQGQRRRRDVVGTQAQGVDDLLGVAVEVGGAEPDEPWASRCCPTWRA